MITLDVKELKTHKKIFDIKSLYLYELGMFIFMFNNNFLLAKFNNY